MNSANAYEIENLPALRRLSSTTALRVRLRRPSRRALGEEMKSLKPEAIEKEPRVTNEEPGGVMQYLDYLIHALLSLGPGRIEAELPRKKDGRVEFTLTSPDGSRTQPIGSLPPGLFRTFLAGVSTLMELPDIYMGHNLFVCDHECDGRVRRHRFGMFLCNEPAMAVWFKLYLYCIDGVWPMKSEE
jgi:hypothetical protein